MDVPTCGNEQCFDSLLYEQCESIDFKNSEGSGVLESHGLPVFFKLFLDSITVLPFVARDILRSPPPPSPWPQSSTWIQSSGRTRGHNCLTNEIQRVMIFKSFIHPMEDQNFFKLNFN